MKGFYFKYKNLHLTRIWAHSLEEALTTALKEHSWCGVECSKELTLVRVNSETMYS